MTVLSVETSLSSCLQVYVQINGVDAPYHMKVGDTGEAFFVFETDQDVPADMQTSPLTGPIGNDEGEEVMEAARWYAAAQLTCVFAQPEPLDLGDSLSSLNLQSGDNDKSCNHKKSDMAAEQQEVESKHHSLLSQSLEGAARKAQTLGSGAINVASAQGNKITSHGAPHIPDSVERRLKRSGSADSLSTTVLDLMARKNAVTEEAFVASEFEGTHPYHTSSSPDAPKPFGTDPNGTADGAAPLPSDAVDAQPSTWEQKSQELMLDMAGYKMDDGPDGDGLKTPPANELAQADAALDMQARNDILNQAGP